MGGEVSKSIMPVVEEETIIVSDAYVLRQGRLENGDTCSVFSGVLSSPLLTSIKNLKTHRHPNILRYLSSGEVKGRLHIVSEPVLPLSRLLPQQTLLQICVGLHSLITALTFLHNKANASHNNICCASVYVTPDGIWKLGGLEFMLKFNATTAESLRSMRDRRYAAGIPPEESNGRVYPAAIDVYGLGVFITELLKNRGTEDLPSLQEFMEFCERRMVVADPKSRAPLSEVLSHPFFSHDFIRIHRFLSEMPLRTFDEKQEFFRELEQQLILLPETMVASQLLSLLLARLVILDSAAQTHLLPSLLNPRADNHPDSSMFSEAVFKKFVVPKLLQMFRVRDKPIRLLLLSYLPSFIHTMTKEELRSHLLPEILLGVKDENDELVAATLRSLALLVEVLGGESVIGGKRGRHFSDGRPATRKPKTTETLPERPSPDGGEDSALDDTLAWSDWEQSSEKDTEICPAEPTPLSEIPLQTQPETKAQKQPISKLSATIDDLDALDVKSSSTRTKGGEDDFFRDMEPVICRTEVLPVADEKDTNMFKVCDTEIIGVEWDSFEDWGDTDPAVNRDAADEKV